MGSAVLGSGKRGGGAVRAGDAGSFVRAVHPAGAVSLRSPLSPSCRPPSQLGSRERGLSPSQAVARRLNPLVAQPACVRRSSQSS